jgi:hypothetical protein
MIKKLRNQPYALKVGESSQTGAKRKKKITTLPISAPQKSALQIY